MLLTMSSQLGSAGPGGQAQKCETAENDMQNPGKKKTTKRSLEDP